MPSKFCTAKAGFHRSRKAFIKQQNPKHQCETCGEDYVCKQYLQTHIKTVHTKEFNFFCDKCDTQFVHKSHFVAHKKTHDPSNKIHICEDCGKGFHYKHGLKNHKPYHTDERPYSCRNDGCDKRFKTSAHRGVHEKSERGERTNMCNDCGAAFVRPDTLSKHKAIHTGEMEFKYKHCEKGFNQKSNKDTHEVRCSK